VYRNTHSPHFKLIESRVLEKHNVYTIMVPRSMTSILQPLDVIINRSLQKLYAKCYDKYLENVIDNPQMRAKVGYLKVTTAIIVSNGFPIGSTRTHSRI
jgi:hypothetical protein